MTTAQKLILSMVGAFLLPATLHLQMHLHDPVWGGEFWLGALLAGLYPVAAYLVGFYQINPANQPRTPEALISAVQASAIPRDAKAIAAEAIGTAITTGGDK
jgi:hypothetical protein